MDEDSSDVAIEQNDGVGEEISEIVFRAGNRTEDIQMVRAQGLDVDDDNEPSLENIPTNNTTPADPNPTDKIHVSNG